MAYGWADANSLYRRGCRRRCRRAAAGRRAPCAGYPPRPSPHARRYGEAVQSRHRNLRPSGRERARSHDLRGASLPHRTGDRWIGRVARPGDDSFHSRPTDDAGRAIHGDDRHRGAWPRRLEARAALSVFLSHPRSAAARTKLRRSSLQRFDTRSRWARDGRLQFPRRSRATPTRCASGDRKLRAGTEDGRAPPSKPARDRCERPGRVAACPLAHRNRYRDCALLPGGRARTGHAPACRLPRDDRAAHHPRRFDLRPSGTLRRQHRANVSHRPAALRLLVGNGVPIESTVARVHGAGSAERSASLRSTEFTAAAARVAARYIEGVDSDRAAESAHQVRGRSRQRDARHLRTRARGRSSDFRHNGRLPAVPDFRAWRDHCAAIGPGHISGSFGQREDGAHHHLRGSRQPARADAGYTLCIGRDPSLVSEGAPGDHDRRA